MNIQPYRLYDTLLRQFGKPGLVWFADHWTRAMTDYIKFNNGSKPLVGVEVGCREGWNSLNMLSVLPIKKLYMVDIVDVRCKEIQRRQDVLFINGDSIKVSKTFADNSVDFVYLDSNPDNYEFAINQIKSWYPKCKKYFGGHDFSPREIHTARAVLDFADVNELDILYGNDTSDWWFDK